jgi:glycosyltransferase involved in cell wall biosynthesis
VLFDVAPAVFIVTSPAGESAVAAGLRILSLSTVFPNPGDPILGTFVHSRLRYMAAMPGIDLRVVAPIPILDYPNYRHRLIRLGGTPLHRADGGLNVMHPRWIYPPAAGGLNGVLLGIELLPYLVSIRRNFRFDVIDAHFAHPEGVAASILAAYFGCPFTITVRGNEVVHAQSRLKRKWMRWALSRASRIFTVSGRLRDFAIANGANPGTTLVVPNGIDPAVFHPRDRQEVRSSLGIPATDLLVLSAGYLTELKGHHRVVRTIKAARERGLPARLVIVGGGLGDPFAAEIERTIRQTEMQSYVRLVGRVNSETMAEWMSAADLFCLASHREGWPNVVHEALACGTPVVATDVGAVPDLIPDARYGTVVPPGDQNSLDTAVCDALTGSWDRTAIAALGMSRTWREVAAEVLKEISAAVDTWRGQAH